MKCGDNFLLGLLLRPLRLSTSNWPLVLLEIGKDYTRIHSVRRKNISSREYLHNDLFRYQPLGLTKHLAPFVAPSKPV